MVLVDKWRKVRRIYILFFFSFSRTQTHTVLSLPLFKVGVERSFAVSPASRLFESSRSAGQQRRQRQQRQRWNGRRGDGRGNFMSSVLNQLSTLTLREEATRSGAMAAVLAAAQKLINWERMWSVDNDTQLSVSVQTTFYFYPFYRVSMNFLSPFLTLMMSCAFSLLLLPKRF